MKIYTAALLMFLTSLGDLSAQKKTIASGNFSDPAIWNTPGIPSLNDMVTIQQGHIVEMDTVASIKHLSVADSGIFKIINNSKIELTDGVTIDGRLEVNEGDITLVNIGGSFKMGTNGYLLWAPANNTAGGTSLFLNGVEDLNATSTINIEKWFNYTNTPLGSVVTGNFGHVILNSISNGLIFEWNQQNYFEQHVIMGTLSINQGWIVLDKSGTIQNTFINAIHLNNINSYLDMHSGNHPGTFSVRTNEIKNTGGTLNGLINGNGNIRLEVNGNFSNLGNACLIYNSGVANTSNGNAFLKISGKFTQTHGDFRGIFNISSTSSGKSEIEMGEAEITGGIFMANYGCHIGAQTSNLKINGNLVLNYIGTNGKFRGNGLSSLSGIQNNIKLLFTVGGDLTINGINGFEFISSGSSGSENVSVSGDANFNGGNIYFNMGDHLTELLIEKSLFINGGTSYLSRKTGTLSVMINGAIQINSGELNIKGDKGNANLTVLGDYGQTGGTVMLHNNITEPTSNVVYFTVHGNFSNYSGNLIFDNNSTSAAFHKISLNGSNFNTGGSAQFNSAASTFGLIYYDHIGEKQYNSMGTSVLMQNIKQIISAGCTLKINTGNMQVSSTKTHVHDLVKIEGEGILDLGSQQLYSNQEELYSGIYADENGKIRISKATGLYDGTSNGAINAIGNMSYNLHSNSTIEYYGNEIQLVTGVGTGTAQETEHQYGILEINKTSGKVLMKASDVIVRTGLYLNKGELDLNGYNITINSGKTHAITRSSGYIRSEPENPSTGGQVKWRNIEQGMHSIPFGISEQNITPITFTPKSGLGREFAASTKRSAVDNRPLLSGITNLKINGIDGGTDKIIDRWYYIKAQNVIADISLSYLPEENTTQPGYSTANFSIMSWSSQNWNLLGGTGTGSTTQTGKVSLSNTETWGYLLLASHEAPQPADILDFTAKLFGKQVNLEWIAKANIIADKYSIERTSDEINYVTVVEQAAMPHSTSVQNYSDVDYNPLTGISYYRLKQHGVDGTIKYSPNIKINNGEIKTGIELITIGPNPFTDSFTATFNSDEDGVADIKLTTITGQKIYATSMEIKEGSNTFNFVADAKMISGIYLLTISDLKTKVSHKLFKK